MRKAIPYIAVLAIAGAACGDDDSDDLTTQEPPEQPTGSQAALVVNRVDIVSDQTGEGMTIDTTLVNAWGLAFNPMGAAWVSATETGLSEVYDAQGNHLIPSVSIPPAAESDAEVASPTGQIFNPDTAAFAGDSFIFVTEEGTISGWDLSNGAVAVMRVDNSAAEAVYKGVTATMDGNGQPLLFAADFRGAKIDVFDGSYNPIALSGTFTDPDIPSGFAPFNIRAVPNMGLVVTFAMQDEEKEDDVEGAGNGYVSLFDAGGNFVRRLISQGELDSPWGITMTPDSFTAAPGRLLIGNFGDGVINVYTVDSSMRVVLEGALRDSAGADIVIDGLWALEFGIDAGGFRSDQLYFTAGPDDETHGLFGRLESAASASSGSSTGNGTAGSSGEY